MSELVKTLAEQIENEQNIIYLMLKNRNIISEMEEDGIYTNMFNSCHHVLVKSIFEEHEESNGKRLLTRDNFKNKVQSGPHNKDLLKHLKIYDKCIVHHAKEDDFSVFKLKLKEGYISRHATECISKFQANVNSKGWIYAVGSLQDSLNSIKLDQDPSHTVFESIASLKDQYLNIIQHERENPSECIICNIPEIDECIGVGFKPQHLTLFVSDTGVGKTNIMLNIGLNIADQGHSVLFIPLEMPWSDLMRRIVCNRFNISPLKLSRPQLLSDEELESLKTCNIWNNNNFHILDSSDRFSLSFLKRELEKRIMVFKPKIVIVDYLDLLQSDTKHATKTEEISDMVHSIRNMGKKYGFHILSAAQLNRAAIKDLKDGKDPDSRGAQGSHSYSTASDTIFSLAVIPEESDKLRITAIKTRHSGKKGYNGELRVDPSKFLISSTNWVSNITGETDLDFKLNIPEEDILNEKETVNKWDTDIDSF